MDFSNYITFSNLINMFGRVVFIENINQVLFFVSIKIILNYNNNLIYLQLLLSYKIKIILLFYLLYYFDIYILKKVIE